MEKKISAKNHLAANKRLLLFVQSTQKFLTFNKKFEKRVQRDRSKEQ